MNVLAFDVGGTSMKYGIVSSSLEIVKKGILDTPNNEIEFLNAINQIIESYKNDYEKISIAMPGFINKNENKFLYGTNIKFEVDFKKIINFNSDNFYLDNDGNVAAYAEYIQKYKNEYNNLIMLTFGTGIGGGIIFSVLNAVDSQQLKYVSSDDEAVMASVGIYLNVINLFSFFMSIIGMSSDE